MELDVKGVWRCITRQDHISNSNPRRRRVYLSCGHIHDVRMDTPPNPAVTERFDGSEVGFFCTLCKPNVQCPATEQGEVGSD